LIFAHAFNFISLFIPLSINLYIRLIYITKGISFISLMGFLLYLIANYLFDQYFQHQLFLKKIVMTIFMY